MRICALVLKLRDSIHPAFVASGWRQATRHRRITLAFSRQHRRPPLLTPWHRTRSRCPRIPRRVCNINGPAISRLHLGTTKRAPEGGKKDREDRYGDNWHLKACLDGCRKRPVFSLISRELRRRQLGRALQRPLGMAERVIAVCALDVGDRPPVRVGTPLRHHAAAADGCQNPRCSNCIHPALRTRRARPTKGRTSCKKKYPQPGCTEPERSPVLAWAPFPTRVAWRFACGRQMLRQWQS